MACITLLAPPMAMTTTQLARAVRYENAAVWQFDGLLESKPLRLSWVVVTDADGNRRLQMHWASMVEE